MNVPHRLRREGEDALLLALAVVLVPATWRLLLGWSWPLLIAGHDGLAMFLLAIRELVEAHGRWPDLAYRPDIFGGMKVRDTVGPLPALSLLARLPLSPTAVFNLFTFLLQVIIAFLSVRCALDLAAVWAPGARPRWLERAAGIAMCAFAPALAWRLGYGHHTLVVGGLPFLAAAALLAAAGAGTVTVLLVAVATATLVNGILFTGHQMVLYGVVFGGPILLGLWISCGGRRRGLVGVVLTCLAALLIALPGFWGVIVHAVGTDSLRAFGRMQLTYSWLTSQPLDWITSIPWTRRAVPFRRPVLFHHEVNYAAGPLLAALALVPWRRARALAAGLVASVVTVLLFSMNLRPFSTLLMALIPPLNTFRVPPRAILPALALLPVLVLAAILARREAGPRAVGAAVVSLAAAAVFFVLPSLARELLGWAVVFGLLGQVFAGRRPLPAVAWTASLLVLAAGSVAAFRERLLPFVPGQAVLAEAEQVGASAVRAQPALGSPLVRANVGPESPDFDANTALAARLSSIEGYLFPSRRFVELLCALRGQEYRPSQMLVRFPEDHPTSRPMFALYDVAFTVRASGGSVDVRPLSMPAGPAWFSTSFRPVDSYATLGRELLPLGDSLGARAHQTLWLVGQDPRVAAAPLPAAVDPACRSASVRQIGGRRGSATMAAVVETPADCPLTFAMTYAETLRATVTGADGQRRPAPVFPAYGALAAVWVPARSRQVEVEATVPSLPWPPVWIAAGLALLVPATRLLRPPPAPV